jgi:hypothetical protein
VYIKPLGSSYMSSAIIQKIPNIIYRIFEKMVTIQLCVNVVQVFCFVMPDLIRHPATLQQRHWIPAFTGMTAQRQPVTEWVQNVGE